MIINEIPGIVQMRVVELYLCFFRPRHLGRGYFYKGRFLLPNVGL
jgi:hypothetical protein